MAFVEYFSNDEPGCSGWHPLKMSSGTRAAFYF